MCLPLSDPGISNAVACDSSYFGATWQAGDNEGMGGKYKEGEAGRGPGRLAFWVYLSKQQTQASSTFHLFGDAGVGETPATSSLLLRPAAMQAWRSTTYARSRHAIQQTLRAWQYLLRHYSATFYTCAIVMGPSLFYLPAWYHLPRTSILESPVTIKTSRRQRAARRDARARR